MTGSLKSMLQGYALAQEIPYGQSNARDMQMPSESSHTEVIHIIIHERLLLQETSQSNPAQLVVKNGTTQNSYENMIESASP